MRASTALSALITTALLSGCARNVITLDRGGAVASAGSAAVGASTGFIERIRSARDDANIQLVASDTSCGWGESLILRGDRRPQLKPPLRVPLCLPRGITADLALGDVVIDLRPVSTTALRPMIGCIGALATYLDAVNAILERDDGDAAGRIAEAFGQATQAQADIAAITGEDLKVIPSLADDQTAAIKGLIGLIDELARERRKVADLRRLVVAQNAEVKPIIARLKALIEAWSKSSLAGDLQMSDATFTALGRRLAADPPQIEGFEARQALLRSIVAARRNTAAVPVFTATVTGALDEMAGAQDALAKAFTDQPDWTPDERAKATRVNRERLLGALHSIAGLFKALAPV